MLVLHLLHPCQNLPGLPLGHQLDGDGVVDEFLIDRNPPIQ
jgi:hypothetical protein